MENLLIIGINTRSLVNSAINLDYTVFSTSYFQTADFPNIKHSKYILKESEGESTGSFEDLFNPKNILNESEEYLEIADKIVLQTGVYPTDFKGKYSKYKKKIVGNKNIGEIEDKFKFYKKINKNYLTPKTFKLNDIDEAIEINKNYPNTQFILKPLLGSGGYDINLLNNNSLNQLKDMKNQWLLQEYVEGINVSSSVLGTGKNAKHVVNSRLLTGHDFGEDNFLYVGNILPLTEEIIPNANRLNKEMKKISEELINDFKLVGSNGIDFIANENGLYVIELNPRIQGTYECVEKSFNINLLYRHIEACEGNLMQIPKINQYSYKKIIYTKKTNVFKPLPFNNIYDLPHNGSITEKGEPLLTIIDQNKNLKKLIKNVNNTSSKLENSN